MTSHDIEHDLAQLGAAWPIPSVAEQVMAQVKTLTPEEKQRWTLPQRVTALVATAAAVLLAVVPSWLFIFGSPRTLQAEVQQAIIKAGGAHITISNLDEKGVRQTAEIWFSCEHGFRAESATEIIVDNGKQQLSWHPVAKGEELIVGRRQSRGAMSMFSEQFQLGSCPPDWKKVRSAEHDREIQGQSCQGFLISAPQPNQLQLVVLADSQQRVRQVEERRQVDGVWRSARQTSIDYDQPIPAEKFIVTLPEKVQFVDSDRVLEDRFPLERALATTQAQGLLFAVHEVSRADDDMFFVISSVRGTPEYLKQFPPQRRRLNLQTTILDVAEQLSSPGTGDGHNRAVLGSAESEGVHYLWWIVVRRRFFSVVEGVRTVHGELPSLEAVPGRVRLPLSANLRASQSNHRIVTATVEVQLPADQKAKTLLEICGKARRDLLLIQQSSGPIVGMDGGVKNNTVHRLQPDQVSDAEFADELAEQIQWLHDIDKVTLPPATLQGLPPANGPPQIRAAEPTLDGPPGQ